MSSDTLTQAKKQGIIREQEEEQEAADKDRQIRLATNEEAKVRNVVDSSCKITYYVLPIA